MPAIARAVLLLIGGLAVAVPSPAQGVASPPGNRIVVIDRNLGILVDGKPFLPIGAYHVPIDQIGLVASKGFNVVENFGTDPVASKSYLDEALRHGVLVLLDMSYYLQRRNINVPALMKVVRRLSDHPALLAWYLVDEPSTPAQLEAASDAYRQIKEVDPNHPVYMVIYSTELYSKFQVATDILAVDPYPIPYVPIGEVYQWVTLAVASVGGRKPVWLVPQAHDLSAGDRSQPIKRGPTPEEERCMVYQGIIGGARGVVYFAWHVPPIGISSNLRLMDAIEGINRELSGLAGFVVGGRRTLVPSVPPDDDVKAALFTTGKTSLLIATNVGAISKRCTLESPLMRDADVLSGNATANRGTVHLTLQPYEVALVRMSSRN